MNSKIKGEMLDNLFEGVLVLKNLEECYDFFEDLCTMAEMQSMGQRFKVAKMLKEGSKYSEIAKELDVSTATISRVNRALNYGSDGYEKVLKRLLKEKI